MCFEKREKRLTQWLADIGWLVAVIGWPCQAPSVAASRCRLCGLPSAEENTHYRVMPNRYRLFALRFPGRWNGLDFELTSVFGPTSPRDLGPTLPKIAHESLLYKVRFSLSSNHFWKPSCFARESKKVNFGNISCSSCSSSFFPKPEKPIFSSLFLTL